MGTCVLKFQAVFLWSVSNLQAFTVLCDQHSDSVKFFKRLPNPPMPLTPPTFSGIRDPAGLWEALAAGMLPTVGMGFASGPLGFCRSEFRDQRLSNADSKYLVFSFPQFFCTTISKFQTNCNARTDTKVFCREAGFSNYNTINDICRPFCAFPTVLFFPPFPAFRGFVSSPGKSQGFREARALSESPLSSNSG